MASLAITMPSQCEKIIIYTDGGSRGNPGPAAFGALIERQLFLVFWYGMISA
jgi:hypothetical protein